jgi:hypothetical protein
MKNKKFQMSVNNSKKSQYILKIILSVGNLRGDSVHVTIKYILIMNTYLIK